MVRICFAVFLGFNGGGYRRLLRWSSMLYLGAREWFSNPHPKNQKERVRGFAFCPFCSLYYWAMGQVSLRAQNRNKRNLNERKWNCLLLPQGPPQPTSRAELAFSPSSEKWPGNTFLDVKSRLESIARIGLLKKNDPEVAYGR